MDLKRKLPGYVAWAMRLVVWPVAILVILGIAYFYSALRLASHGYYVAKWKATRPQSVYEVTLTADRRFVARAVKVQDRYEEGNVVTGAWIMEGQRRIAWLYDDAGRIWPPERNRIVDAGPVGFTIVEENGSRTRYELRERIASSDCAPDPG